MSWIETIARENATGRLGTLYARAAGPDGHVDNILRVHSLRPHTLEGHLALYKAVLHSTSNRLPDWVLETIGVHVSRLNGCAYCVEHHFAGLVRLIGEPLASALIEHATGDAERAMLDDEPNASVANSAAIPDSRRPEVATTISSDGVRPWRVDANDARLHSILAYATRLTQTPERMTATDVETLRESGLDDGEILEVNQVVSYFAYANRTVLGLGVTTEGDVLGRSPSNTDDVSDWTHR